MPYKAGSVPRYEQVIDPRSLRATIMLRAALKYGTDDKEEVFGSQDGGLPERSRSNRDWTEGSLSRPFQDGVGVKEQSVRMRCDDELKESFRCCGKVAR